MHELFARWKLDVRQVRERMYRRAGAVRQLAREPAPEVRKLETSAMAGLLATLQMGMGLNVLLYLLGALDVGPPERALLRFLDQASSRFADGNSVRFVALLVAVVFVGGFAWAVVYSHLAVPLLRLPPWLRGLAFSALPLAFSVLVLMPLLGAGPLGLGLEAGLLPLAGEVVRNALFGVGLAASYSLLRVARQRPARAVAAARRKDPDGQRWTEDAEHYVLDTLDQPAREVGLALGRTSRAVDQRRAVLRERQVRTGSN